MNIHPTAIVDPKAELGADVVIGPYSIIDAQVVIGDRVVIGPHVHVTGRTTIGDDCELHTGVALGGPPQDRKYNGEPSYLRIGQRNIIREYVTMHLAVGEGNATVVGDDNMIMACAHIGHNCVLGSSIYMSNYVGLSGGCQVDDRVVLGGMSGLHQFVHIGRMVMVGGYCKVAHDIPPFVIVDGPPAKLHGLNTVGLRRAGVAPDVRNDLKKAYRMLCYDHRNLSEALLEAKGELSASPEVEEFIAFLERSGRNGRHLDPGFARCASAE